jgi:hypothetical protein
MITIEGCRSEPCRMMIGLSRDASVSEIREVVVDHLRQQLEEHRPE